MMKRFYSHYSFIYPDVYLKNYIVEVGENNHITACFLFEREIENTSFYSGLLLYIPQNIHVDKTYIGQIKDRIGNKGVDWHAGVDTNFPGTPVFIYTEEGILL